MARFADAECDGVAAVPRASIRLIQTGQDGWLNDACGAGG
jgi:hypothetical protein